MFILAVISIPGAKLCCITVLSSVRSRIPTKPCPVAEAEHIRILNIIIINENGNCYK